MHAFWISLKSSPEISRRFLVAQFTSLASATATLDWNLNFIL